MKITISGLAGTGTSTLAKELAKTLGYTFNSSGNMFRELAKSLGLTLNQLDILSQQDSRYDIELDKRVKQFADSHKDCVIDSRLAWYFVPDSVKVKLVCDDKTRFGRIAGRENISLETAEQETREREEAMNDRYLRYYGIDKFDRDENFDLIINTKDKSVKESVDMVINYINNLPDQK